MLIWLYKSESIPTNLDNKYKLNKPEKVNMNRLRALCQLTFLEICLALFPSWIASKNNADNESLYSENWEQNIAISMTVSDLCLISHKSVENSQKNLEGTPEIDI